MFFQRKGKLRKEYDEKLLMKFNQFKVEWQNKEKVIENSLDPTDEVMLSLQISKAKCMFILNEIKERQMMVQK